MRGWRTSACVCAAVGLWAAPARAWLFHEHERVGRAAVEALRVEDRSTLNDLWRLARPRWGPAVGAVCEAPLRGGGVEGIEAADRCVDLAVLPALAGDHACSLGDLQAALGAAWTREVLSRTAEAARAFRELGDDATEEERVALRRRGDADLAREDPGYLPRAGISHFQLARRGDGLTAFLAASFAPGATANATAAYANFHAAALRDACAAARRADRSPLAARAVLAEAMALHFLEDSFSAGHTVGAWGSSAERMGTHDRYNAAGLSATTFGGRAVDLFGDAFLRPRDVQGATPALRESLAQLARAWRGEEDVCGDGDLARAAPDVDYSVCDELVPTGLRDLARSKSIARVISDVPMPGPFGPPLPRGRNELGFFVGVRAGGLGGLGALTSGSDVSTVGRATLALTLGLGVAGALGDGADNTFQIELLSTTDAWGTPSGDTRVGLGVRLRTPFSPVDGLVAAVRSALGRNGYQNLAWVADGGVLGIARRRNFASVGTWQIVLGRDVAMVWYPPSRQGLPVPWDLYLPAVEFRFDRRNSDRVALSGAVALGLMISSALSTSDAPFIGASLSLVADARYYFTDEFTP